MYLVEIEVIIDPFLQELECLLVLLGAESRLLLDGFSISAQVL